MKLNFGNIKSFIKKKSPDIIIRFYSVIIVFLRKRVYKRNSHNLFIGRRVKISENCRFGKGVRIDDNVSLSHVDIGDYTYFSSDSVINFAKIGRYCSIGPNVRIGLGMHPSKDMVSTFPSFYANRDHYLIKLADKNYFIDMKEVIVGNDVWIGTNATVKDGVKIGNGAIIGAGAVVVKDVAPYSIVGGVPAKLIRYRFELDEINFLENFKWWDKPEDWIKNNWRDFFDIKKFTRKHNINL